MKRFWPSQNRYQLYIIMISIKQWCQNDGKSWFIKNRKIMKHVKTDMFKTRTINIYIYYNIPTFTLCLFVNATYLIKIWCPKILKHLETAACCDDVHKIIYWRSNIHYPPYEWRWGISSIFSLNFEVFAISVQSSTSPFAKVKHRIFIYHMTIITNKQHQF